MSAQQKAHDLEGILDEICEATRDVSSPVEVDSILDKIGHRAFGPFLVLFGVIGLTPLGGVPILPTTMAALVIILAAQLIFGKQEFWIPHWIRKRSFESKKIKKSLNYLYPVARTIDKVLKPRFVWLTKNFFLRLAAALCVLVALTVPPLEIVPFAGAVSWAAIGLLGLALIAQDGLIAILSLGFGIAAGGLVIYAFI